MKRTVARLFQPSAKSGAISITRREFGFRFFELPLLHRLYSNAKNPIGLGMSRATPRSPQHRFGGSGQCGVIAFESLEKFCFSLRKHNLKYLYDQPINQHTT